MTTPISSTQIPASVRADGPEGRKLYAAALGFEQTLLRTLTAQLAATVQSSEGEEGGDPASGLIRDQIPDALAEGITSTGGLGLAESLYAAMKAQQS